ncbi:MAG: AURKAIP1/COX24 domain-containing protein [Anaerolineae bacterium]|nr:AURKAIP1/COX24 domain-containing protein [Anaerolineae bacterium]
MGSVIKKRRKKIARHKFRKRMKKERWRRRRS